MSTAQFTAQQIRDWVAYERVRRGGAYNMFDPRAIRATGLTKERYLFALKHYTELRDAAEKTEAT